MLSVFNNIIAHDIVRGQHHLRPLSCHRGVFTVQSCVTTAVLSQQPKQQQHKVNGNCNQPGSCVTLNSLPQSAIHTFSLTTRAKLPVCICDHIIEVFVFCALMVRSTARQQMIGPHVSVKHGQDNRAKQTTRNA